MANLYNAEGYVSPTEYAAFTRIEKAERAAVKAAAFRPIVYICSPYSGEVERNLEMARKFSRFAVDQHCLPISPHIYFTQFITRFTACRCLTSRLTSAAIPTAAIRRKQA